MNRQNKNFPEKRETIVRNVLMTPKYNFYPSYEREDRNSLYFTRIQLHLRTNISDHIMLLHHHLHHSGAPNENIVQNHSNIALLNVF